MKLGILRFRVQNTDLSGILVVLLVLRVMKRELRLSSSVPPPSLGAGLRVYRSTGVSPGQGAVWDPVKRAVHSRLSADYHNPSVVV